MEITNKTALESSESKLTEFITSKELQNRLSISRKTAWNWEQAGKLAVVKINRTKRYHWPTVKARLLTFQRNGFQ